MLYRIRKAVAHPDHTVTVTWSDGIEAVVDLSPMIAKGNVFAPLQDGHLLCRQHARRRRPAGH